MPTLNNLPSNLRHIVEYLGWLQMKGAMGECIVRLPVLADKFDVSVSTMRRYLTHLQTEGYVSWEYASRQRYGGRLRRYLVSECILREMFSGRFIDKKLSEEHASVARLSGKSTNRIDNECNTNNKEMQATPSSIPSDEEVSIDDLLHISRHLYINGRPTALDDAQRGFLAAAARKYGVTRTWLAFKRAIETEKYSSSEVVRITWAILRRQAA